MDLWSWLLVVYVVLSVVDCVLARMSDGFRVTKVFLMPVLAAVYTFYLAAHGLYGQMLPWYGYLILAGLLFGWLGDVLLNTGGKMFMAGLLSFLVGHLCYMVSFIRQIPAGSAVPWWSFVLLAGYAAAYAFLCGPFCIGQMKGGVKYACLVYMTVIAFMSISAMFRFTVCATDLPLTSLVWIGSVLFIVSDTLLARHTFLGKPDYGVMETYTVAQLLIIAGSMMTMGSVSLTA